MPRAILVMIIALTAGALFACDAHDYWLLTDTLTVDSTQEVTKTTNQDDISQDLFVRYQLDYELTNLSDNQSTEVVVSATSYVNGFKRATGHKVWHLEPSQMVDGILMTNQLELGNKLVVSLECCNQSVCSNREVICPPKDEGTTLPSVNEIAEFCYDSCEDTEACIQACPAESECKRICTHDEEDCRQLLCTTSEILKSCDYICNHDPDCIAQCQPTEECQSSCISLRAACFKNCLATWNRCEEEVFEPSTNTIPCALCQGEGACETNFTVTADPKIKSTNGQEYSCDMDCRYYPASCVTGCEELYEDKTSRVGCLDLCLQQHLYWCNDYTVPVDYVDTQGQQPCCFGTFCQNSLDGVVKSYDVECFNDTSCSSGKYCSSEGICVSYGTASNCMSLPLNGNHSHSLYWLLILLGSLVNIYRRKDSNHVKV